MRKLKFTDLDMLKFESSDEFVCFSGGYTTLCQGCPPWGSVQKNEVLYFGDNLGQIQFISKQKIYNVPLILGYNVFMQQYCDYVTMQPFCDILKDEFLQVMFLKGVLQRDQAPIMKIDLCGITIEKIKVVLNKDIATSVEFLEVGVGKNEQLTDEFFENHTIKLLNPYPDEIKQKIELIKSKLYTLDKADFAFAENYERKTKGATINFSGSNIANAANNVFNAALDDIQNKLDSDGNFNASSPQSANWYYDGFAGYRENVGAYQTKFYSRDLGIGINALLQLTKIDLTKMWYKILDYVGYFTKSNLKFKGHNVKPHFTVVLNEPMFYSKVLTKHNWPTVFTKEKFGSTHANLGNLETDGHGLGMLALLKIWQQTGCDKKLWIESDTILDGLAQFIVWQLENSSLNLSDKGILYSESEAGMLSYTMYCNIPCLIAIKEWSKIYPKYNEVYLSMVQSIEKYFVVSYNEKKCWDMEKIGFYHDCVLRMFCDFYGASYENQLPEGWNEICRNTYYYDRLFNEYCFKRETANPKLNEKYISLESTLKKQIVPSSYFGAKATGYDHCNILSNALLLDNVQDYKQYFINLIKVCYAQNLPNSFLPPEGYSFNGQYFRRQGDIGNLAQEGEVLNVFRHILGLGYDKDGIIFKPRHVTSHLSVKEYKLHFLNKNIIVSAQSATEKNSQTVKVELNKPMPISIRFGAFDENAKSFIFSQPIKSYYTEVIDGYKYVTVFIESKTEIEITITIN